MACTSLIALPRACGAEGIIAGLEKLYVIAYSDLAPATGVAGTPIYTTTTGGVISDIGLASGKVYVQVGLLKSTAGVKENMTKDSSKGIAFFTQEFSLTLADLTVENKTFIESVLNQPISILIKSRTGKYFVAGLNGLFELSALEGGTGTAESDLIGYTLTFQGLETKLIPMVDAALIPTLLTP